MFLSASSFGRSFLVCLSGSRRPSFRRCVRLLLAARRRWPSGHIRFERGFYNDGLCVLWMVPGDPVTAYPLDPFLCGVLIQLRWR